MTVFSSCCSCGTASAWLKVFSASLLTRAATDAHTVLVSSQIFFPRAHLLHSLLASYQIAISSKQLTDGSAEAVSSGSLVKVVGGRLASAHADPPPPPRRRRLMCQRACHE